MLTENSKAKWTARSPKMVDAVEASEIQFAKSAIVQDGHGAVLLLYTGRTAKLPTMLKKVVTKRT